MFWQVEDDIQRVPERACEPISDRLASVVPTCPIEGENTPREPGARDFAAGHDSYRDR